MKKLFAIALAIAMIATLSVTAFATTLNAKTGNFTDITVSGSVTELGYIDAYKVTLTYSSIAFEYSEGTRTWDPDTLTWGDVADAEWVTNTANIVVTNYSSAAVTAQFGTKEMASNVAFAFSGTGVAENKVTLAQADVEGDYEETGEETTATVTVTANGTPAVGVTTFGKITVALI